MNKKTKFVARYFPIQNTGILQQYVEYEKLLKLVKNKEVTEQEQNIVYKSDMRDYD